MTNPGPHSSVAAAGGHATATTRAGEPGWRGPQVCAIVGITYRQLDYWARTQLVAPSLAEARGSGTVRRYSHADLVELAVIKRLLDAGISLQSARRAITHLRDTLDHGDTTTANLVLTGTDTLLATSGDQIAELLRDGQGVLNILPLANVTADVDAAITHLAATAATAS